MPNASYPDDDGSRTPTGQHGTDRERKSSWDVYANTCATMVGTVKSMRAGERLNGVTDSSGDRPLPYRGLVDGDSNSDGDYLPAAYPASSGTNGQG